MGRKGRVHDHRLSFEDPGRVHLGPGQWWKRERRWQVHGLGRATSFFRDGVKGGASTAYLVTSLTSPPLKHII